MRDDLISREDTKQAIGNGKALERRWIPFDCDTWQCSECKDVFILLEGTPKDNNYNYCPNCGAKMEG